MLFEMKLIIRFKIDDKIQMNLAPLVQGVWKHAQNVSLKKILRQAIDVELEQDKRKG